MNVSCSRTQHSDAGEAPTGKTRPFITERLLMGGKESLQTNKQKSCHQFSAFELSEVELKGVWFF